MFIKKSLEKLRPGDLILGSVFKLRIAVFMEFNQSKKKELISCLPLSKALFMCFYTSSQT